MPGEKSLRNNDSPLTTTCHVSLLKEPLTLPYREGVHSQKQTMCPVPSSEDKVLYKGSSSGTSVNDGGQTDRQMSFSELWSGPGKVLRGDCHSLRYNIQAPREHTAIDFFRHLMKRARHKS